MVGCETANQIWIKLSQYFASQTRAKVSQLKVLLQNVKKGSMTVNEYRLILLIDWPLLVTLSQLQIT